MLALLVPSLVALPREACAEAARAAQLAPLDAVDLQRIEAYLQSIRTLKAGFQQFNPDGGEAEGEVYLQRPGRMRFEYAPPAEMQIVSDGAYVAVDDKTLKQVSYFPIEKTPVWFLLREGIKLSGDVTVTRFERTAGAIRVTAVKTDDPAAGSITLVFATAPLQLVKWTILDGQGHNTTLALMNPESGVTLDPGLFVLPKQATRNVRTR